MGGSVKNQDFSHANLSYGPMFEVFDERHG
jgi:hypothetical protein